MIFDISPLKTLYFCHFIGKYFNLLNVFLWFFIIKTILYFIFFQNYIFLLFLKMFYTNNCDCLV